MEFIVTDVVNNEPLSASEFNSWDLGVNGLSYLWVNLTGLQAADNVPAQVDDYLAALDLIVVAYNGQSIISGRGREIARMGALISGVVPWRTHAAEAANAEGGISFVIPFGRKLYSPTEGFPKVQRGQLQLQVTAASNFGDVGSPEISVHQVEIPEARFARYNKYTQRVATPAATGNFDIPLPVGNRVRGVMLRSTTRWRNQNVAGTVRALSLLGGNVERYWTGPQQGHGIHLAMARAGYGASCAEFALVSDVAAAYTQFQSTQGIPVATNELYANYAWFDLDPTMDDTFAWDTQGVSEPEVRLDIATGAEEVRIHVYESVAIAGAAAR